MHSSFGLEKAVRMIAANFEHRTLDTGFFTFAAVEYLHGVAPAFRPAGVHPHQHLGPVLCLGAARARGDFYLRVAEIILTAKKRAQLEGGYCIVERVKFGIKISEHLRIRRIA